MTLLSLNYIREQACAYKTQTRTQTRTQPSGPSITPCGSPGTEAVVHAKAIKKNTLSLNKQQQQKPSRI